ncbi:MAG: hypothetical protein IJS53_04655 [Clostridia bacterium]|nr:hypothetical protein [Clostridia bacterium]
MNYLADSLLTALLSWMRSLFGGFLSLVQGDGSGFLSWMKNRWFVLAVFLCLAGGAIDFLVYLLRWSPQQVWRSRLHAFLHRDSRAEAQFSRGYDAGLTGFDFADTPIDGLAAPQPEPMEELEVLEPLPPETMEDFDLSRFSGEEEPAPERRRRSARHRRRSTRFHIRLPDLTERDEGAYVPPVRASDAFHAPVYPAMDEAQQGESGHV